MLVVWAQTFVVFYVGFSKATLRCYTSIFDGIIDTGGGMLLFLCIMQGHLVLLLLHNAYARKPVHQHNFETLEIMDDEDYGYIEAYQHGDEANRTDNGNDYGEGNQKEESYEYTEDLDEDLFLSGGIDAEVFAQ